MDHVSPRHWAFVLALGAMVLVMMWAAAEARGATTLTVTSTADDAGNAPCVNGQCRSLRDAVNQANSEPGDLAAAFGDKPQAVTGTATGLMLTGATLHGSVNPEGAPTIYYFDYGTNTSYEPVTTAGVAGSGTSARPVSAHVTGLKPGTLYHYRIVAQNTHGTVYGFDRTFRTPRQPSLHAAPNRVLAGGLVRVLGNAGACVVGDRVTLRSHAFSGAHQFAGVPAVYARVRRGGSYSTTTRIPSGRAVGRYLVTGRCGGGNLGVSASLTVYKPPVPKFTG